MFDTEQITQLFGSSVSPSTEKFLLELEGDLIPPISDFPKETPLPDLVKIKMHQEAIDEDEARLLVRWELGEIYKSVTTAIVIEVPDFEKPNLDSASQPDKPQGEAGKVWVKDKRKKKGGYWRKAGRKVAGAIASQLAGAAVVGAGAAVAAKQAINQGEEKVQTLAQQSAGKVGKAINKGAIAGAAVGGVAVGAGAALLASRAVKKNSRTDAVIPLKGKKLQCKPGFVQRGAACQPDDGTIVPKTKKLRKKKKLLTSVLAAATVGAGAALLAKRRQAQQGGQLRRQPVPPSSPQQKQPTNQPKEKLNRNLKIAAAAATVATGGAVAAVATKRLQTEQKIDFDKMSPQQVDKIIQKKVDKIKQSEEYKKIPTHKPIGILPFSTKRGATINHPMWCRRTNWTLISKMEVKNFLEASRKMTPLIKLEQNNL